MGWTINIFTDKISGTQLLCIFHIAAAGQQVDCETVSSWHTISSAPFTDKPRSFDGVYTKGNIIGEGRFAVVRSSTHRTSGKECALKIINRAKVFGREDIVENELKIMKSVNHPNIIKLIEDFETDNDIILVMELLQVTCLSVCLFVCTCPYTYILT